MTKNHGKTREKRCYGLVRVFSHLLQLFYDRNEQEPHGDTVAEEGFGAFQGKN